MRGPPPRGRLLGDQRDLEVIALDWAALNGGGRTPSAPLRWTVRKASPGPLEVDLDTPQQPIRVVVYVYPAVDAGGIPEQSSGQEHRCELTSGAWCRYAAAKRTVVTMPEQAAGAYVVLQSAWVTATGSDVQLSYAWRLG